MNSGLIVINTSIPSTAFTSKSYVSWCGRLAGSSSLASGKIIWPRPLSPHHVLSLLLDSPSPTWPSSLEHGLRSAGMGWTPSSAWLDSSIHATFASFFALSLRSQWGILVGNGGCWTVMEYVEGREHRVPSANVCSGHNYSVFGDDTALINSTAGSNPKYWTWNSTQLHCKFHVLFWFFF